MSYPTNHPDYVPDEDDRDERISRENSALVLPALSALFIALKSCDVDHPKGAAIVADDIIELLSSCEAIIFDGENLGEALP